MIKKSNALILLSFFTCSLFAQQTESLYLSGTGSDNTVLWDFFCTDGRNSGEWTKIAVPSNWELQGFGQFTYGHDKERVNESGLYRHEFTVPNHWKRKTINIVFEGSMTDTEVKVNGKSAGETHQGAFYRFKYDISKLLNFGDKNLLEVTVHKSSANESVEGAERRADFWVYGGIYRPVWLEALPETHIERIAIDARCDGSLEIDVFTRGGTQNKTITAQVKTLNGEPFGKPFSNRVNKQGTTRLSARFDDPALWSAEFPNRYMVEVSLVDEGKNVHSVNEKFGFRTAELRPGDGFYVNGSKIKFKGVNRHTHWPTTGRATNHSISLNDALLIKEMNMNAVRMSHYPPDKHFLEVCDSLGLYVIDELTGWQSTYDTPVGKKLVKELITRDLNHPCVVMWANGNEGGFNFELLPEYALYDIQQRHVFHPWLEEEKATTYHYPAYGIGTAFLFNGNKVFFPTEFIHGLYDGGHGAGLDDFWKLMQDNPLSAGGFLWDFADQGVVRSDRNGEIDTDGNHAADGIVGPYREKEGSFFTIKEIWSPIFIEGTSFLPPTFDGTFIVENRYHFTNLNQCDFTARWVKFDFMHGEASSLEAEVTVPDLLPGYKGLLEVEMPNRMSDYDALSITATDFYGREVYTWTRRVAPAHIFASRLVEKGSGEVTREETDNNVVLQAGETELGIDKSSGLINSLKVNGKSLSLGNGPRFVNEGMNFIGMENNTDNGVTRIECSYRHEGRDRPGNRDRIKIELLPSEWIEIDYTFDVGGFHDNIGVTFDYPEEKVKHIKWLGNGPYRVWKNRTKGVSFNIWEKDYNNTVTGESWEYPEFKGYHSNLYAADISTEEGIIRVVFASDDLYLHLFTPDEPVKRNNDNTLGKFPEGDISFLNAISPVGTKFKQAKDLGPQSQQNYFLSSGHAEPLKGKVYIKFIP